VGAITGATSNAHEEDTADSVVFLDSDVSLNSDFTVDGTKLTDRATIKALFDTGGGGGHTIQDEGTPLTQRANLNFVGSAVEVTDDVGNDATVVTITASGLTAEQADQLELSYTGMNYLLTR
jgi:hypothetical protein